MSKRKPALTIEDLIDVEKDTEKLFKIKCIVRTEECFLTIGTKLFLHPTPTEEEEPLIIKSMELFGKIVVDEISSSHTSLFIIETESYIRFEERQTLFCDNC